MTIVEMAGIMGAKQTQNMIPMCHQIPLDFVKFKVQMLPGAEEAAAPQEMDEYQARWAEF